MAAPHVQGWEPPTANMFFVDPASCQVSWLTLSQMIDQVFKEVPVSRMMDQVLKGLPVPDASPQMLLPGLKFYDQATPDSSFAMLAFKETLQGETSTRTYLYTGWTEETRSLALAVLGALQATIEDSSISEEANDIRTYLLKLIGWLLNGEAYLGMLQGWMLHMVMHCQFALYTNPSEKGSNLQQAMEKPALFDLNLAMTIVLRNAGRALSAHYRLVGGTALLKHKQDQQQVARKPGCRLPPWRMLAPSPSMCPAHVVCCTSSRCYSAACGSWMAWIVTSPLSPSTMGQCQRSWGGTRISCCSSRRLLGQGRLRTSWTWAHTGAACIFK